LDLLVRPIHHRLEGRVRAHILISMLSYYVQWHMQRAWSKLLYRDEELERDRGVRDPVKPAQASVSARGKKRRHEVASEGVVHSFRTLMAHLGTQSRNTCQVAADPSGVTFEQLTEPDPLQREAFELLAM
jgi:hypothetical protein